MRIWHGSIACVWMVGLALSPASARAQDARIQHTGDRLRHRRRVPRDQRRARAHYGMARRAGHVLHRAGARLVLSGHALPGRRARRRTAAAFVGARQLGVLPAGRGARRQPLRTPKRSVRLVDDGRACRDGQLAASRPETPQIYVQVPDGKHRLPEGFSTKNTVTVNAQGKPFKGKPSSVIVGVGILGGAAAGVGISMKDFSPGEGSANIRRSVTFLGSSPPAGSDVPANPAALSMTLRVTSSREMSQGFVRVNLNAGTPEDSLPCAALYGSHPAGNEFVVTVLGPEVPAFCRLQLPLQLQSARVIVQGFQGRPGVPDRTRRVRAGPVRQLQARPLA